MVLFAMTIQSVSGQTTTYSDSWSSPGFTLQEASSSGVTINHSLNTFFLVDVNVEGTTAKTVKVPGIFLPSKEGAPDLPGHGKYVAVPQGAEAVLEIKAMRKEVISNVEIAPAPAIPLDTDPSPLQFIKDRSIYLSDQYYPAAPVTLSEPFKIRGVDVVMLEITPFQYNPVQKELIIYRDLVVEVNFQGGNGTFGEERLRSRWWDPMLQKTLINAKSLTDVDYSTHNNNRDAGEYEYVIITPDLADYITWANTIKDFRIKQGINTGIVTTTELGGNTVSNIEAYVDNAYYNWAEPPAAVLLLGDYSTGSDGITSPFYVHVSSFPDYASDNGYADVDGDDLPDIIFARITARNATELETMVTKFIDYETNPPTNPAFYDQPITALGWQTERWFQICSEVVGGYFRNVQGKNPTRINKVYIGNPSSDPWSTAYNTSTVVNYFGPNGLGYIPSTPQELGGFDGGTGTDVVNAINSGAFMLQHRDHGYYTGWGEPSFNTAHIPSLTNVNNELTYVFSINCQTGAFHRSTECFAEKFHRHTYNGQNAGALGIIAATEVSYSFVNDTYVWGVIDNMFPDFMPAEGTQFPVDFVMPGFGNAAGKYYLQQSTWVSSSVKQITYRLFHHHGDAYLNLYTEVPVPLTVSHAPSLLDTETSLQVTADDGSFIAVTANGQILGTATGTGSAVNISIPAQPAGTVIFITVTKQNHFRYEGTVDVTGGGGVVANFTVSNQEICAGETVTFTDQSSGEITGYNWDFGASATPSTYSGPGPVDVTYNASGSYDVSLTVTDGTNNDTETKTGYITVDALTADFTVSSTTIPVGGSVTFNNLSSCATGYDWQFPGGEPAESTAFNPGTVTYNNAGPYDITLTVSNGITTDSKTVTITVNDISYCASNGNPASEWIQSIEVEGQLNNSGQSASGYEDFTGIIYNLSPGSSHAIILTPGFANRPTFEYWNVWIDFNMDGDFGDSGELALSVTKKRNAVNGVLNIPSSATGTTIMRISMKEGTLPTSCETGFPGEVEDYTVSFSPPTPQPPIAEFTADNTNIPIGGTVNFTDLSQNEPTSWSWSFPGGTPATSTQQNPSVTYAGAGTFDATLTVSNAQGTDVLTKTGYITVSDNPTPQYCIPVADNSSDHIVSIQIGSTTSNSGQGSSGGYDYFTTPSFSFSPGSSYNVTLVPLNDKNKNFWRLWIDFNNDGDFDDSDETLLVANNKKGTYSNTITIPTGVEAVSPDRMRIAMKTGSSPSACETGFPGEVEDYDVYYGDAEWYLPVAENALALSIFPNPARNIVTFEVKGGSGNVMASIYNATGKLMSSFQMTEEPKQIQLNGYGKGLYFVRINDGTHSVLRKFIVN
jgi:PKD repeat protein